MLQATVQGKFPFNGRVVRPGDVIDGEELASVSRSAIDALVNQKMLVLSEEGAQAVEDRVASLEQGQREIASKLDKVLAALTTPKAASVGKR